MSDDGPQPDLDLAIATTASNEIEAAMVAGCLRDAGIVCMYREGFRGEGGSRSVYVRKDDLERAREALSLKEDESE